MAFVVLLLVGAVLAGVQLGWTWAAGFSEQRHAHLLTELRALRAAQQVHLLAWEARQALHELERLTKGRG